MVCTWFWKGKGSPLQEAILRHQQGIQEFNSILILPCFPKNNTPPWVRSQMCSDHSFSALRQLIVCLVGLQIMRLIWNLTFKTLEILLPFKTLEILLMQKFADIQLCILLGSVPSIPSPAPPFPFILKSLVQRLPPPGGSFDSKFHHHGKTICI